MSIANKIEMKHLIITLILILSSSMIIPHKIPSLLTSSSQPFPISFAVSAGGTSPPSSAGNHSSIILFFMRPPHVYPDQMALVNLYRQYISPTDYVITFTNANMNYVNMLSGIKVFGFNTVAEVQKRVPTLRGSGISVIALDIEQGNRSSLDMVDPVASVCKASQIAHQNGFKFMANPGLGANIPSLVGRMASCSDIFLFQAQGHQRSPEQYHSFAAPSINAIRAVRPDIPIIIQVSFMNKSAYDPNPAVMVQKVESAYASVGNIVNGVAVFYGPNPPGQLTMMEQFFNWVQQNYRQ